jgi:hypothetical protein
VELPFNDVYRFLTNRMIDLLAGQAAEEHPVSSGGRKKS